jgi:hypothetical protein
MPFDPRVDLNFLKLLVRFVPGAAFKSIQSYSHCVHNIWAEVLCLFVFSIIASVQCSAFNVKYPKIILNSS